MTGHSDLSAIVDFERLFLATPLPMALLDASSDFVLVSVNDAYCETLGRPRSQLLGKGLFEAFPGDETVGGERAVRASFEEALATDRAMVMPLQRYDVDGGPGPSERYWSITNTPFTDSATGRRFILIHPEEVTSFVQQRLDRGPDGIQPSSAGEARAVSTVFTAALSRLQSLNDLTGALVGARTTEEVARALLRDGLGVVGARAGSLVSEDGDQFRIAATEGVASDTATFWSRFPLSVGAEPFSDALATGEPLFFGTRADFLAAYPLLAEHLSDGDEAWAVLPLRDGEQTYGVLGLIYGTCVDFDSTRRLALYTVASLASQAMSRAHLLAEQSAAMESIDRTLLAMIVEEVDGLEVSGFYKPSSQAITAGGDWYDVVGLGDGVSLIAIGDVANHGPGAVGEMAHARSVKRAVALDGRRCGDIAAYTSQAIERFGDTHATATIALYEHASRRLEWTSAGHPPAVWIPGDRSAPVEFLAAPHGPPLGVGSSFGSSERIVGSGDRIVLYTDGLIEKSTMSFDDSLERLVEVIEARRDALTPEDLFAEFHPTSRHVDDIALVIVKFV